MIVLQAINPEHPELADDPDLAAEIAELEIPFVITQDVKDFLKFALALNKKTQEFIDKATQVMKNQKAFLKLRPGTFSRFDPLKLSFND